MKKRSCEPLNGLRFGRWTVLDRVKTKTKFRDAMWDCLCDCGNKRTIPRSRLTGGRSKSCGCASYQWRPGRTPVHGKTNTKTYRAWADMKHRCLNKNFKHKFKRDMSEFIRQQMNESSEELSKKTQQVSDSLLHEQKINGILRENVSEKTYALEIQNQKNNQLVARQSRIKHNEALKREIVEGALNLVRNNPEVGAILLECSDMPPYAADVQRAVNLPVYDFITLIKWVYSSVAQKPYHGFI